MLVCSDRCYRFAVPPEELWDVATSVDGYRGWWPWLRSFDGAAFAAGEVWSCVVQPPLPYAVRFRIALDEVVPTASVRATISGDIVGEAALDLQAAPGGCEARLVSHLAPANGVLRAVARLARPVVRFGHDWVLDTGARQFTAEAIPTQA